MAAGALLLSLAACEGGQEQRQASRALPAGQRLLLAASDVADMKPVGAEITTRDSAEARARIGGTLVSRSVRAGDSVKKGQLIALIVDTRLAFETSNYAAQVAAAQAQAVQANAELGRIQYLCDRGVYAKARLDEAKAAAGAANAQVAAARAQQAASATLAQQGAVFAPATGRVLRADIPDGSVVTPGSSIATVTAGPPVLRLMLPESAAGQVHLGSRVVVTDTALPQGSREGVVAQVYPSISAGQIQIDATLPGLTPDLIGQRVGASVEVGRRRALIVPRHFVTTRFGIDQVSVVTPDKYLSSVPVQIAPTGDPDRVEILSGVSAGDTLFSASKGP
jgi:RND family efflux transporter MFP subunit